MRKCRTAVIPSAARDLVFSDTYEEEIPRLRLGMTVATQSVEGEGTSLILRGDKLLRHLPLLTVQPDALVEHLEFDQMIILGIAHDAERLAAVAHNLNLLAQNFT